MPKDDLAFARERLGQVLRERWLLEQVLGIGGMAAVYAARHRNGTRAAIKLLHGPVRDDPVIKERFLREAYLANTVAHPGVARVLDDDEDPQLGPYLIMELLEGESIDEVFKKKQQLSPDRVLDIADQILDVLAAAHDRGIVHRDLKPANLFLCRDGAVKVLDFGIARVLHDNDQRLTATGMMMGTPAYMAPEQARTSGKQVDGRSDVYSVGATMFRVLAGRHVHLGKMAQLIVQVATERAPKLATISPQVPAWICAIVDRACEFEPERRYPSARDMQSDVRSVRAGRPPPLAAQSLPIAPPIPDLEPSVPSARHAAGDEPRLSLLERARDEARAVAARADFHPRAHLHDSDAPTRHREAPERPPPSSWRRDEPTTAPQGSIEPTVEPRAAFKSTQYQVAPNEPPRAAPTSLASTMYAFSDSPARAHESQPRPAQPQPQPQPVPLQPPQPQPVMDPGVPRGWSSPVAPGPGDPSQRRPSPGPVPPPAAMTPPQAAPSKSTARVGWAVAIVMLTLVLLAGVAFVLRARGLITLPW